MSLLLKVARRLAPVALAVGLSLYATNLLQKLSGGALWLPVELREFVGLVVVFGAVLSFFAAVAVVALIKSAARLYEGKLRPQVAELIAKLGALAKVLVAIGLVAVAIFVLWPQYHALAGQTTQRFKTSWNIEKDEGGKLPPYIQKLAGGSFLLRVPRKWPDGFREEMLFVAQAEKYAGTEEELFAQALEYKLTAAPAEVLTWYLQPSVRAELDAQLRSFLFLHAAILACIGLAAGLTTEPVEAVVDLVGSAVSFRPAG